MEIKKSTLWVLLTLLTVAAITAINMSVALSTPLVFGDEGYYAARALWIKENWAIPNNFHFFTGGSDLLSIKFTDEPLVMIMGAGGFLFGEWFVKVLDATLAAMTALLIFLFGRRLADDRAGFFASSLFLFLPQITTYAIFLYTDMLVALLSTFAVYLAHRASTENNAPLAATAGLACGLAAITKITGLLPIIILIGAAFIYKKRAFLPHMIIAFLVLPFAWHIIHNVVYQDGGLGSIPLVGGYLGKDQTVIYSGETRGISGFEGRNTGVGTEGSYLAIGLINYLDFAYTLLGFSIIMLGLSYMLKKRGADEKFLLLWISTFTLLVAFRTGVVRAEDFSRWTIPAAAALTLGAGIFLAKFSDSFNQYGHNASRIATITLVVALLGWGVLSADAKAQGLVPVKQFSQGFFDGCDWIQTNTAEDARFLTLWAHRAYYHCERDFFWSELPDLDKIVLGGEDERLKAHGIEYIYVQKFSIQFGRLLESYPVDFIQHIESSPDKFKNVYENNDVVVYRVV